MSKTFRFKLPIVELAHLSGTKLSSVSSDLQNTFINRSPAQLVQKFSKALKKALLEQGEYTALLKYLPQAQAQIGTLALEIPPSQKRLDDSPHTLNLHTIAWHYPDDTLLTLVPALAVGFHNKNHEHYEQQLKEVVLLNFKRANRFDSHGALIATQWFSPPDITTHDIDVEFYTPLELNTIAEGKEERILPKTAHRMRHTQQAFFGLDAFVEQMQQNLEGTLDQGQCRQSVLIVGPSSCGKTALVQAYEQSLKNDWRKRPWITSAARMLQALTESGGWQYGLGQWVRELRESAEVVYIGNLAEWFEVGQYAGNSTSIAEALRDPLQRGDLLLIGEATEEQINKIELRSPGFAQLFHVLRFGQRSVQEENTIAADAITAMSQRPIAPQVIDKIQYLQRRYAPYSGYPGKTIRFFETLLLQAPQDEPLNEQSALKAFSDESGMPMFLIDPNIPFDRDAAQAFFQQGIIGQQLGINELLDAIVTTKTGMTRSGKPIISLLFVGPTGVGKTQMAKTLAQYIFGDQKRMIRFDMSEYSDPYAVLRLTSANESSLVAKVRQQPFSLVLFDEIEKAAYNFFDLLLQVLGEGRLTDDRGDVANFCSTIIIMTSNMGAQDFMKPPMGFSNGEPHNASQNNQAEQHFEAAVTQHFRPELFNRLDRLVPFVALNAPEKSRILKKELAQLLKTPGVTNRRVQVSLHDSLWPWLEGLNIDFRYGARAIQRTLQKHIVSPLAQVLAAQAYANPIEVTLRTNTVGKLEIQCTPSFSEKKSVGVFMEFTNEVAHERRQVQGLGESGPWISLLSRIDQLEQKKKRDSEKFWNTPELSHRYGQLCELQTRYLACVEHIYALERDCLANLQQDTPTLTWEEETARLNEHHQRFETLLFDIETMNNPDSEQHLLSVCGPIPQVDELAQFYETLFEQLGFKWHCIHLYYVKNDNTADEVETLTKADRQETALNELTLHREAKGLNEPGHHIYWKSPRLLRDPFLQRLGALYEVKGPCAAHFLSQEAGVVEIREGEQDKERLFVELADLSPGEYDVPQEIHRKKFTKGQKTLRKIEYKRYHDKRFDMQGQEDVPLNEHHRRVTQLAKASLLDKLIHKINIRPSTDTDPTTTEGKH